MVMVLADEADGDGDGTGVGVGVGVGEAAGTEPVEVLTDSLASLTAKACQENLTSAGAALLSLMVKPLVVRLATI